MLMLMTSAPLSTAQRIPLAIIEVELSSLSSSTLALIRRLSITGARHPLGVVGHGRGDARDVRPMTQHVVGAKLANQ